MQRVPADPIDQLRARTSAKWRLYPDDVLPLPVAEMDYPLAEPIADALHAAIRRSDTGYASGGTALAEAFGVFAAARLHWEVDPARVTTTADVSMGVVEVLRQAISPGEEVVITPPVYPPFFNLVTEAGGRVVEVPLAGDVPSGWSLDLAGIEAAFARGARAILLCNPHNPVGLVHDAGTLAALAELAARFRATVVSDEVHGPLAQSAMPYVPFLTVSDAAREHGVAVTGATKAFNVAGLKAAAIVTASDRGDRLRAAMPEEVGWRMSQFGSIASVAAFRHGGPWLDGVLASLDDNRRLLADLLEDELPGVGYRVPDATYLAWLDLRALGWGDDPAAVALERARVALASGPDFGRPGRGFARLNFACSPEVLGEAVTRLADARSPLVE
ncbi:MalY/PatB family protein [Agromyces aerolatus]|uniref:MalY/PatB family protein n=1 Tax=Agromyces sp. LY-1074 TaxID=3074080 RepID=UPI00285A57EE|nr:MULTISPECIES: aminotransferase class I/II-fold pyridoxal phosphate-dependent enzyme [unclassified Agromyces]MDR5698344.1 aminotransferase class I/II-fold pyridoxal phosphate-dependent enzyme [Agromyces sp. LY-1074]MDR5704638.1 aminotransferase class I/II-fold pyridoxal phosphate-dependent enzyme [Agromyces sp. LY-1358]